MQCKGFGQCSEDRHPPHAYDDKDRLVEIEVEINALHHQMEELKSETLNRVSWKMIKELGIERESILKDETRPATLRNLTKLRNELTKKDVLK